MGRQPPRRLPSMNGLEDFLLPDSSCGAVERRLLRLREIFPLHIGCFW